MIPEDDDDELFETEDEVAETPSEFQERDFSGTPYVPVYVILLSLLLWLLTSDFCGGLSAWGNQHELPIGPEGLVNDLRILKAANVDGVMVDRWWGIVENRAPQVYHWSGYKKLFQIVKDVVMSFHECGGNIGDDVHIPLPRWVSEIGRTNPDIYFTDWQGRRNTECLTWGIDKEQVLRGRTALESLMSSSCAELCYPSCPAKHGWEYPGIGKFQCDYYYYYYYYYRSNIHSLRWPGLRTPLSARLFLPLFSECVKMEGTSRLCRRLNYGCDDEQGQNDIGIGIRFCNMNARQLVGRQLVPKISMQFTTEEEAYQFYLTYGKHMQVEDPNFFYAIQVDEDELITNIF
ncbi:hypothetical protein K2173_006798 [Erythroxylum novogranatense]|uniref:Beta-amylase n=1 Tax=Erythroxylum novogranatense TaxID=1862640 RepID=A0AAV8SZ45_9ROSI|nr:hypothetical protein K2173_006798 [Erythroxylum novogranatense]